MKDKQNQSDAQQHLSQTVADQPVATLEDQEPSPALTVDLQPSRRKKGSKGGVYLSALVEQRSYLLVRLLGYGLLVFSLFDYLYIVIPPHLTDPVWEFETIGALVEHVAAPLLGLLFIFYRHQGYVSGREKQLLRALSWGSLLFGLLYLLMLPLGIADTWRIYNRSNTQIASQLSQQAQQFKQTKGQLNQATDKQLQQLAASLAGRSPAGSSPAGVKNQFLAQIIQAEQSMQAQADQVRTTQNRTLIKNSVKWNLGALVAGTLLIWIWRLTSWARKSRI